MGLPWSSFNDWPIWMSSATLTDDLSVVFYVCLYFPESSFSNPTHLWNLLRFLLWLISLSFTFSFGFKYVVRFVNILHPAAVFYYFIFFLAWFVLRGRVEPRMHTLPFSGQAFFANARDNINSLHLLGTFCLRMLSSWRTKQSSNRLYVNANGQDCWIQMVVCHSKNFNTVSKYKAIILQKHWIQRTRSKTWK